ncbi:CaiB/BaiF CoA transferase family protein [Chloroflexota bacterium]
MKGENEKVIDFSKTNMEKLLTGIRMLDFSRYKAGPYCGMLLADMGAEVIRVERPEGEDDRFLGPLAPNGESMYLMFTCRNKKCITLNLQSEQGMKVLKDLVKKTDVVLESLGLKVRKKFGLDYESLKAVNPEIIAVSISGFGNNGPYAHRLSFDPVAQAIAGIMNINGYPDIPPLKTGVNMVDFNAGVYAALGTMYALYHRQKTGQGQEVDIALLDVAATFLESMVAEYKVLGQVRQRLGNRAMYIYPCDSFKTKDDYVYIAIGGNALWNRFLKTLDRKDLIDHPDFNSDAKRVAGQEVIAPIINQWLADKTAAQVVDQLIAAGIPCGKVNTIPEAADDPQIKAREMLVDIDHPGIGPVPLTGVPVKMSLTPGQIETPAPNLGEHNEEIYRGLLGYSNEKLSSLADKKVI